ncbi:MAG TPA: hypothetical protein VE377_22180 [Candidatus Dormibacteraeota bacterium]|nr:hypothetical protein [Candidatus Dormibacteraeota bacterium]
MTLAVAILLFGISGTAQPVTGAWQDPQSTQPAAPANSSASAPATPEGTAPAQATPAPTEPSETKPSATGSATKPTPTRHASSTAKKPHHRKKVVVSDCDPAPAPASTSSSAASPDSPTADGTPAQANATPSAPKECPPAKIIVRHGGTAEPSIQLAGGATGDQASGKRDAVNQMLELTEGNLKKIAGHPLSTTQQDAVSQIRQFVDQSKAALAAGDSERAHTLAWKAELLSEDLVKPQQ